MNKVILSGRLIGPIYQGPGRVTPYFRFRMETPAEEEGRWPDRVGCVAFGALAEQLGKMREGDPLALVGRVAMRSYQGKDGSKQWVTEVTVGSITQEDTKFEAAPGPGRAVSPNIPANPQRHITRAPVGRQPQPAPPSDTDDEVPF